MKGRVGSAEISFERIWNFELQSYVIKFDDYFDMLFINLHKNVCNKPNIFEVPSYKCSYSNRKKTWIYNRFPSAHNLKKKQKHTENVTHTCSYNNRQESDLF